MSEVTKNPQPNEPVAGPPQAPANYGFPQGTEGLLSWPHVVERLENARSYWLGTTRPDGRPHATPIWGCWVDGALYFDGSPETQWARNMAKNPAITIHLE